MRKLRVAKAVEVVLGTVRMPECLLMEASADETVSLAAPLCTGAEVLQGNLALAGWHHRTRSTATDRAPFMWVARQSVS